MASCKANQRVSEARDGPQNRQRARQLKVVVAEFGGLTKDRTEAIVNKPEVEYRQVGTSQQFSDVWMITPFSSDNTA